MKLPLQISESGVWIRDADGEDVVHLYDDRAEINNADCVHIVRCVNAHDGLLAACEALLQDSVESSNETCWCNGASLDCPHPGPCEACMARTAIANAKKV